jgi:hypothetical protein
LLFVGHNRPSRTDPDRAVGNTGPPVGDEHRPVVSLQVAVAKQIGVPKQTPF